MLKEELGTVLPPPQGVGEPESDKPDLENEEPSESPAAIGRTHGRRRENPLRYMPPPAAAGDGGSTCTSNVASFPPDNYPKCGQCGGAARPSILQFGDYKWEDSPLQDDRYNAWTEAVCLEAAARKSRPTAEVRTLDDESPLKVVVLEVGAGNRVPTVRYTSEATAFRMAQAGADVSVVRVNPLIPHADHDYFDEDGCSLALYGDGVGSLEMISILEKGLKAIEAIDHAIQHP